VAQLYPLNPKQFLALQDKDKALSLLTRIFEEEIMDQLDDMDRYGLLVDDRVIEGFGLGILEDLKAEGGPEMEIYQEAVEKAVLRIQGIRHTSH
jgi:hypothetical protein